MRRRRGAVVAALGLVVLAMLLGACAPAAPTVAPGASSGPAGDRTA